MVWIIGRKGSREEVDEGFRVLWSGWFVDLWVLGEVVVEKVMFGL